MKPKTKSNGVLLLIAGLAIGGVLTFAYFHFASANAVQQSYGKAEQMNGVYLFIESAPVTSYTTVGTINADDLTAIADSLGMGKKQKVLDIINNVVKTGRENLVFEERLKIFVERAQQQFGNDAQGLVFVNDLRSATVIKF